MKPPELPKLVLVGPTPPPYHGVAVAMHALLNSDLRRRFSLVAVDLSDRRGIHHVNRPDGHDVLLFLRQWLRLFVILCRDRPRLVYIPVSQSTVGFLRDSLFIWPSWLSGSRIVLHLHGGNFRSWYEGRGRALKAYVRIVIGRVSRMVVLGESLRDLFSGLLPPERVLVVPNGIDGDSDGSADRVKLKKRRYRVLYLGTLNRQKGALVLIAAVSLVARVRRDVEFVFAGPWSNRDDERQAEAMIAYRRIADAVSFVGLVKGEVKRAVLTSADIFVFPGVQQEGQPLVVIEAMAAGLPVVFTNRGCLRETVVDHEHGLEVRVGDPEDLARKIIWLLANPGEMRRMGVNGRWRYERLYTQSRFVSNMADVFSRTLEQGERHGRVGERCGVL